MIFSEPGQNSGKNGIYFIIDKNNSRCGITDRLKAAVGLYYLARLHGLGFHFIHRAGFDLCDYLMPNEVPWSAELSDISAFPWKKQQICYLAPYTDLPEFRKDRQYVCRRYIGNNLLEKWNVPDWQQVWRGLFHELFIPSDKVLKAMASDSLPERYTAVVFRFINSLGHTEEADYNGPLDPDTQKRLISVCLEKAAVCEKESGFPAVIYSDSVRFLETAAAAGFRTTDASGVGNIMNKNVEDSVILGTFVNLFRIAEAEKVYSVLDLEGFPGNVLYKTQYPRYAAIIGDRPFIRC